MDTRLLRAIAALAALAALSAACSLNPAPGANATKTPQSSFSPPADRMAGTALAENAQATVTANAQVTATRAAIGTATAAPALAEPNAPHGWNLILYEPFADNARKWPEGPDDANPLVHVETRFIGSEYMVTTRATASFSSYFYPQMPDVLDFYATVDGRVLGGDPTTDYGLIAALDPQRGDYYAFLINPGGVWAFSVHQDNAWAVILSGRAGQASPTGNHLAVLCRRGDFTFYINNQPVVRAHDERLSAPGKVGLIVEGGVNSAEAGVAFDDFSLLTP